LEKDGMLKLAHLRRPALLAATTALLLAPAAVAADGPTALFDVVRAAVTRGEVEKTRLLGSWEKDAFRETPHGGALLVGFDVSLGKWVGNAEYVYGLEPLYLTSQGVVVSTKSYGVFPSNLPPGPRGRELKPKLTRVVRVKAKPGYAVGGLTVRSGLLMDGLSVTFNRIKGQGLDREQSYDSDWVGSRGGSEASLTTIGDAAVGVFGALRDYQLTAIGLITVPEPAVEAAAPPAAGKAPEGEGDPAPAKHSARAARAAKRAGRAAPRGQPNAPDPEPATAGADDAPGIPIQPDQPAAGAAPAGGDETMKWLVYAVIGGIVAAVGLVLAFQMRGRPAAERGPDEDPWPTGSLRPANPTASEPAWPGAPARAAAPAPAATMTVGRCMKCSHVVWPEDLTFRLPAWCPLCRSDLERVPADSVPPPPQAVPRG
jgi:hypothetical protein